jgi:transcriptional regulator with XRE-family HTH domain
MSAEELGKKLGKDRATIYRYEKGDIENLPLDILTPLAEALETTPQYLMGWEKIQKDNEVLADLIVRLRSDETFRAAVLALNALDSARLTGVVQMLDAFKK